MAPSRDTGYFTDRSMIRRALRERALALAAPRALLMQAAHPLAVAGLLAHSDALEDPYVRLGRTARVMRAITFGSRAEADRLTGMVRAMHSGVSGRLQERSGIYPAGTPYRADDPALLMWILYSLVDSVMVVYETYVARLSARDRAALWDDYRVVGGLFGLSASAMPATVAGLDDYGAAMLSGDELHLGPWARSRAREIVLEPPVPLLARPLVEAVNFTTIALLPERIRRDYGFLPVPPATIRIALVQLGALYVRRGLLPVLPPAFRRFLAGRQAA